MKVVNNIRIPDYYIELNSDYYSLDFRIIELEYIDKDIFCAIVEYLYKRIRYESLDDLHILRIKIERMINNVFLQLVEMGDIYWNHQNYRWMLAKGKYNAENKYDSSYGEEWGHW